MANLLTSLRLLLIAPVVYGLANPGSMPAYWLALLFLLAIASDFFDGKVARATNTASARGMLFDHATDFLFVTATMAALAFTDVLSPILPVLVTIAFSQYVLDSYFWFKQKQLRMSFLGRWNGVFYFGPALFFIASQLPIAAFLQTLFGLAAVGLGYGLILSTLLSIADRTIAPLRANA
ncbi:MAG: phosphatidylglycerophosphate synthase [Pseudohongiellaceae bacterium]|jgi:phosphatidylglycerophosphate synthase